MLSSLSLWKLCISHTHEHTDRRCDFESLDLILHDRFTELIDDLRAMQIRKENKVLKKQQMYGAFREKLNVSS